MNAASGRLLPWALVSPALLWTLLFFVLPFVAMAVVSLSAADGSATFDNYRQFFANPSYRRAMLNSLEVTAIVTMISVVAAYPFAWTLAGTPTSWFRRADSRRSARVR